MSDDGKLATHHNYCILDKEQMRAFHNSHTFVEGTLDSIVGDARLAQHDRCRTLHMVPLHNFGKSHIEMRGLKVPGNILDDAKLAIDHTFDIVCMERLRILGSIRNVCLKWLLLANAEQHLGCVPR